MQAISQGNTYGVTLPAAVARNGVAPNQPKRVQLLIQNTGANPATVKFGQPCNSALDGFVLAAGALLNLHDPCPPESLNFFSTLGTTLSIYEGVS